MNYYVGNVRNQRGLDIASNRLRKIEEHIKDIKAANHHELLRVNETRVLLKYCQLMVKAVLERKESGRGFYKRSDYPDLDPKYDNKQIAVWQENGEIRASIE